MADSELRSIVIPSSVVILGHGSFSACGALETVVFESGSRLELIGDSAFDRSGLHSIIFPSSVVVLGKRSFCCSASLGRIAFDDGSRLERIEESAFAGCPLSSSALTSILIPPGVAFVDDSAFGLRQAT
jgi:hypothetical protein